MPPPVSAADGATRPRQRGHDEAWSSPTATTALLRSALQYANDTTPPVVNAVVDSEGKGTYEVRFTSNEASSIYYTTDGSTPTTASTEYKPPRARALPLPVVAAPGATLKWIAPTSRATRPR